MADRAAEQIVGMLKEDHQKVKDLFEEFKQTIDSKAQQQLVDTALRELDIHAKLEEGLIYPAIREEIDDEDLMDEALEEHHLVHILIKELKRMKPRDERFKAKFTVLGESVKHHIKEEESEMLPKAQELHLDWEHLEQQAMKRKQQLLEKETGSTIRRPRRQAAGKGARRRQRRA